MKRVLLFCVVCHLGVLGLTSEARAQSTRPKAQVVALTEHAAARAGETARVALKVSLPEGLHTQSNKPRDPLLIPTELTIDAPAGVTVKEIVWPPSTDLKQAGQDQPLAVFEQTFAIGVQLALAGSVPAGSLVVPMRLRYQPSGREPRMILCSRQGIPFAARGVNQKGIGGLHRPVFEEPPTPEHERSDELYIVGGGAVEVWLNPASIGDRTSAPRKIASLQAGQTCGELALLDGPGDEAEKFLHRTLNLLRGSCQSLVFISRAEPIQHHLC